MIKSIFCGPNCEFKDLESALEWVRSRGDFIDKSTHYIIKCYSAVEVD